MNRPALITNQVIPRNATGVPVAGMPDAWPRCVPPAFQRTTTTSPSAVVASTTTLRSGNASSSAARCVLNSIGPRTSFPSMCPRLSGLMTSSIIASRRAFHTSSNHRVAKRRFSSLMEIPPDGSYSAQEYGVLILIVFSARVVKTPQLLGSGPLVLYDVCCATACTSRCNSGALRYGISGSHQKRFGIRYDGRQLPTVCGRSNLVAACRRTGIKRTFGRNGIKIEHGPMEKLCACLRARVCGGESPPLPRFAFRVWRVHRTRATCAEAFFYLVSGSDIPR